MTKLEITEAYTEIEKVARHFINTTLKLRREYTVQDLTQEVYMHFLDKCFFEKYDSSITSFKYFVAKAAKNHIIDKVRKSIEDVCSLEQKVGNKDGEEGISRKDMIEEVLVDQYSRLLLKQLIDSCPNTRISPNYDLTWKRLLQYIIEGYTNAELHKIIGISSGRISQLEKELMKMLKIEMDYNFDDMDDLLDKMEAVQG